jgi:hypothetical protein
MKIEQIPTDKLIPYARNAKKHDAALEVQKQALRADHICAQVTALPEQLRAPLGHGEHCSFGSGGTRRPSGDSPT